MGNDHSICQINTKNAQPVQIFAKLGLQVATYDLFIHTKFWLHNLFSFCFTTLQKLMYFCCTWPHKTDHNFFLLNWYEHFLYESAALWRALSCDSAKLMSSHIPARGQRSLPKGLKIQLPKKRHLIFIFFAKNFLFDLLSFKKVCSFGMAMVFEICTIFYIFRWFWHYWPGDTKKALS